MGVPLDAVRSHPAQSDAAYALAVDEAPGCLRDPVMRYAHDRFDPTMTQATPPNGRGVTITPKTRMTPRGRGRADG